MNAIIRCKKKSVTGLGKVDGIRPVNWIDILDQVWGTRSQRAGCAEANRGYYDLGYPEMT